MRTRLQAIAELVAGTRCLLEVGAHDASVSRALLELGAAQQAICSDRSEAGVGAARAATVGAAIEVRHGSGLSVVLEEDRPDTLLLCGLGGRTVMRILEDHPDVAQRIPRWVLAPQSDVGLVRTSMARMNRRILDERVARERDRAYFVLACAPTDHAVGLTEAEASLGPVLMKRRDPEWLAWLEGEHARMAAILERAPSDSLQRRATLYADALADNL